AAVPGRLRDEQVRTRGDGGRSPPGAAAVGYARRDRRARPDRDADVDEAAAGARGLRARGRRALRRARRALPPVGGGTLVAARRPGGAGGGGDRARAHGGEAEDALRRRPGCEAPRAPAAPPRPDARQGADALPVRIVGSPPW